jgi:hypothetical protein
MCGGMRNGYKSLVGKYNDYFEDWGLNRIILEWIFKEIGWEGVDWIHPAQSRDQGQLLWTW